MHVLVDSRRRKSDSLPDMWSPIPAAKPPAKSNVGEVSAVHADGTCDVALVCNDAAAGGKCGSQCRALTGPGSLVKGLVPPQWQIACSGCFGVNLPHALPKLWCLEL